MSRPAKRSRHSIRPTSQGWSVAIACGLFLSSVLWPTRPLPFSLGLALLLALVLAMVLVPRRLRSIRGRWLVPGAIHAGDEVTVGALIMAEEGSAPVSLGAWDPQTEQLGFVTDIAGLSATPTRIAWVTRFPRRGNHELPPLVIRNEQPFGLLAAQGRIGPSQNVVVRPMLGKVERPITEQLRRWLEEGATSHETGDDEISHLRGYRPGDPMRRINWRMSARARQLLVTQRQAPACHRLALAIDTTCRQARSKRFERLICVAATLVDHLIAMNWTVVLHGSFAPSGGLHGDRERLLDALAMIEPEDDCQINEWLPRGDACLILTLDPDRHHNEANRLVLGLDQALEHVRVPRVQA
ncbi:MAG: DUF58 domain-containing protein [Planctomycetota bacterium]|jgi:uncharacterized protein (DUF58 family)|nr:DUF58 domain-containing protein [Planctomycetota bacterium]